MELHIVRRSGYVLTALVATRDIYDHDELLLKYAENEDGSQYRHDEPNQSYKTYQYRYKVQGRWTQQRNKDKPKDPVIVHGIHQGQKYDKRYIPGIPH